MNSLNFTTDLSSTFPVSEAFVIWAAFGVTVAIAVLISSFLVYHWKRYEMKKARYMSFMWTYFTGVFVLLCVAIGGIVFHLYF